MIPDGFQKSQVFAPPKLRFFEFWMKILSGSGMTAEKLLSFRAEGEESLLTSFISEPTRGVVFGFAAFLLVGAICDRDGRDCKSLLQGWALAASIICIRD
jgi:hypothetical protein